MSRTPTLVDFCRCTETEKFTFICKLFHFILYTRAIECCLLTDKHKTKMNSVGGDCSCEEMAAIAVVKRWQRPRRHGSAANQLSKGYILLLVCIIRHVLVTTCVRLSFLFCRAFCLPTQKLSSSSSSPTL